ncbi:MAG TPA: 4-hydroxy-tetrahydrodipicolinate reductase [Porphyromonadaceae bacterium]|nr:4-hydroxy-tetrahydrodipicolinate reductase [Porphyromonadaceae bacterium]
MKIAIIGYGKMGHEIERIAQERGHEIVARIDINNQEDFASPTFKSADVAIEFTTPKTAFENYLRCFEADIKVVSGTTGWLERMPEIQKFCKEKGKTFFYASNFSLGVNIFFAVNRYLAHIMNDFNGYNAKMKEVHHIHKLDAPSGTAITLAEDVVKNMDRLSKWELGTEVKEGVLPIEAVREGEVAGFHSVQYLSDADEITISHNAFNRSGFALGAVLATEFTFKNQGFLSMKEMFPF